MSKPATPREGRKSTRKVPSGSRRHIHKWTALAETFMGDGRYEIDGCACGESRVGKQLA